MLFQHHKITKFLSDIFALIFFDEESFGDDESIAGAGMFVWDCSRRVAKVLWIGLKEKYVLQMWKWRKYLCKFDTKNAGASPPLVNDLIIPIRMKEIVQRKCFIV